MKHLLRLLIGCGLAATAILILAIGLARHTANLMAPANLVLFIVAIALYLLPTGLALYRDCRSTAWIAALNVFLGWTIFGWFAAIGWAASAQAYAAAPVTIPPSAPPMPHHG